MSKYFFICSCLFLSLFHLKGFAGEGKSSFLLTYKTTTKSDSLSIKQEKNEVYFQGIKLSLATILKKQDSLRKLFQDSIHDPDLRGNCAGGEYTYKRVEETSESQEKGCIPSHRFSYLYSLFKVK